MKPDYLGYVLNTLDPPAQAAVEDHLRHHPEAHGEFESMRQLVQPLAWDTDVSPPTDLVQRTLASVGAADLSIAPQRMIRTRGFSWRRLAQAAAVLMVSLTALGLGVSWLAQIRTQRPGGAANAVQVVACKDNLHKVYTALCAYGDTHGGQYPNAAVAAQPRQNVAGKMIAILNENGLLPADMPVACPAATSLQDPWKLDYAYSLGYLKDGQIMAPRVEEGKPAALMPLMADSSPLDPTRAGHSSNHGGSGQNVLFCDGHVAFYKSRNVGVNGDDIYLNKANKVAAGLEWSDAVLTSGPVPP